LRTITKSRAATPQTYLQRVNRAIEHVVSRLAEPLRLEDVARVALLSPFHFHRIFRALVGETLGDFVKRLRIDRALVMMAHAPRSSLTKIALDCGFSSSSDFSRCFKQRFGVPPSAFDIQLWRSTHRADLEEIVRQWAEQLPINRLPPRQNPDCFKVRIRNLPVRTVAYIRVRDPYHGDAVVQATMRLIAWAERHGLADGQWLGYQWENPEIVSLEACQYQVAVEAEHFIPKGEIGKFTFPPMLVAEVELRGGLDLELRALQWLYGSWLPRSGYVPDDQPVFEAWIGRPFAHGLEHFELHVHLPVRPG
jgi:AraC family transcriptional regulator